MKQPDGHADVPWTGHPLLELELCQCAAVMPSLYGARLLQVGLWEGGDFLTRGCQLPYCTRLGVRSAEGADALTDPDMLPVLSKSVQAVVLPHTLEFTQDPEALISEVHRVLSDDGQLVVLAYNPFSRLGVRTLGGRKQDARWHSLSWTCAHLEEQGFAVSEIRRYGVAWPHLSGERSTDRRRPWAYLLRMWSDAYLILAHKRVIPLTPTRQPARTRPLRPAPLAREAVAQGHCAGQGRSLEEPDGEKRRCVA